MGSITFSPDFEAGCHRELIIADGTVPEILELLQGARVPYLAIGHCDNPLQIISTVLAGESLDTLHILAHGQAGRWCMAGQWVDEHALAQQARSVSTWQADNIALWVCEAGQGAGTLKTLSRLAGAQVYAAQSRLGWDAASGEYHWALQSQGSAARLTAARVFDAAVIGSWHHQLVSLSFQGIYATTASGDPSGVYGEETSSVAINTTPLSTSNVTFSQAGPQFSGNNVLGTLTFDSTTINNALASRPIKSGGKVKGFYIWLDNDNSRAGSAGDTAYILSLDNTFFTNTSVGSSSDRVDSALNAALPPNIAPVAVADISNLALNPGAVGGPALEEGHQESTVNAIGNVLSNDTANTLDTKTVINIGTTDANTAVSASTTASNGTQVIGVYGTLTIGADGSYSYAVNNTKAEVQALRMPTDVLSDTFTYQMADSAGATSTTTLTVKIQGSNDAPIANVDYNIAKESIGTPATGGYSASGNVLTNDTDFDKNGEEKSIANGSAKIDSLESQQPSSNLVFIGDNGFTANLTNNYLYVYINNNYVAVYAADGTTQVTLKNKINTSGANWNIELSHPPAYFYQTTGKTQINSLTFFDGKVVEFSSKSALQNPSSGGKTATVTSSITTGGSTLNLSSINGNVTVGMTISYTDTSGLTTAKVISVNGASITIDKAISGTPANLIFSSAGTYAGAHGILVLNADGSYTYMSHPGRSYGRLLNNSG